MKIQSNLEVDGVITADTPTLDDHVTTKQYVDSKPQVPTGGTTGQVLTKASNTNFDTAWSTPPNPQITGGIYRLGNNSIAGAATTPVRYRHYAQKITVTQESMLFAIEIYCQNNGGSPFNVAPGLFGDASGVPGRLISVGTLPPTDGLYIPANSDTTWGGPAWLSMTISAALVPGDYWIAFFCHDASMPDFSVFKETGPADSSYYWTASGMWLSPGYVGLTKGSSTDLWSMRAVLMAPAQLV